MHIKAAHTLLYFVTNAGPTDEDKERAKSFMSKLDADVKFRNGDVPGNGLPEASTYVYGNIPPEYVIAKHVSDDGVVDENSGARNTGDFPIDAGNQTQGGSAPGVSTLANEVGSVGNGWGSLPQAPNA